MEGMQKNDSSIRRAIDLAMTRHVLLKIRYIDKQGKESVRLVRPESVKGSALFAYCMSRQDERTFVISRIREATLTDKPAPTIQETESDHEDETVKPTPKEPSTPTMEDYFEKWKAQKNTPDFHKELSKSEKDEIIKKFGVKRKKTSWSYWDIIGLIGSAIVLYAFSGPHHERGDTFNALFILVAIWLAVACLKSQDQGGKK